MDKDTALARRRKALNLSQEDLAKMLGVDQATVSRNERAQAPDRRYELALEAIELRQRAAA